MDFATTENLGAEHCRLGKKVERGHKRNIECGAHLVARGAMCLVGRPGQMNAVVGRLVCDKARRMADFFAFIVFLRRFGGDSGKFWAGV
jgi:hypothetical protein